jgi:hypothetical protein
MNLRPASRRYQMFPSFAKRGEGRFITIKSLSISLFQREKLR